MCSRTNYYDSLNKCNYYTNQKFKKIQNNVQSLTMTFFY